MRKILSFIMLVCFVYSAANGQNINFDPQLDPRCVVVDNSEEDEYWNSSFMWYPGQLSAFMQKYQLKRSKERCCHVGYPGNFFEPVNYAFFRKQIKISEDINLRISYSGNIRCYIDNKYQEMKDSIIPIKKGGHLLNIEVSTDNRLPCLILDNSQVSDLDGWQVSIDNKTWVSPETYEKYNNPKKYPDTDRAINVIIPPYQYIKLRNVKENNDVFLFKNKSSLIIDFFHLELGSVHLKLKGKGKISFFIGESINEVLNSDTLYFEQKNIRSIVLSDNKYEEVKLPTRALRYLRIEVDDYCILRSAQFYAESWPVDFLMMFECDNEHVNNLFNAGVASLHSCMRNFYLDGIKRDFLPWAMDNICCSLVADYLFGDRMVSQNVLSMSLLPLNPNKSDLGIVDYPLYALIGFKHNYLRYGNINISAMYRDRIIQLLDFYDSLSDERGFISSEDVRWGFVCGWNTKLGPKSKGTPAYAQMLLYQNYIIGAYFAKLWNEPQLEKKYIQKSLKLRKNIIEFFWDEKRKAFVNGFDESGIIDKRISHHTQYFAVLFNLYPVKYYDYLFDCIIPKLPYYKEDVSYEKGYEFLAYVKAGRIKDMFNLLDTVWGDWLRQGYTRFPENFTPFSPIPDQLKFYGRPYGLSLCHGSNGIPPVIAVLKGIIGFSQSEERISEYEINPNLLNLEWVKGRIPIKEGFIRFEIRKKGISFIEVPEGCDVRLKNCKITSIFQNKRFFKCL